METTASNRRIWIQETAPSVAEILKCFHASEHHNM